MKAGQWAKDEEAQTFMREADMIELDQAFPADPFAQWAAMRGGGDFSHVSRIPMR